MHRHPHCLTPPRRFRIAGVVTLGLAGALGLLGGSLAWSQEGSLLHQQSRRVAQGYPAYDVPLGGAAAQRDRRMVEELPPSPYGSASGGDPRRVYPQEAEGVPLQGASWTYVPPPPVRQIRKHDILTIRVDELARMRAEGRAEQRKNSLYDAVLKDWVRLDGWRSVKPSAQNDGAPRVQGNLNQMNRADASLETRESLAFNIAARVVDIRPNGDLLLEARKTLIVNDNVWETALSGIARPEDVGPDNVVLSRDLLELEITKQDEGHLRDSYRRGWFRRWFETLQPF